MKKQVNRLITLMLALLLQAAIALPGLAHVAYAAGGDTVSKNTTWDKDKKLKGSLTVEEGATLTLNGSVTIEGNVTIKGGGTIKRGPRMDEKNSMFMVNKNATLTIQDIIIDGGAEWAEGTSAQALSAMPMAELESINEGLATKRPAISVNGTLNIEEGAVIQNNCNISTGTVSYAGAVVAGQVRGDSGTINMRGGIIRDNYAAQAGGGVTINSENAEFNMLAGRIENNAAGSDGDAISSGGIVNLGKLNIEGGYIAGNAGAKAGAVYDGSENGLTMTGGLIDAYNKATGSSDRVADGVLAGNMLGEIILSGDAHIDAGMNLGTDENNTKHIRLKDGLGNGFVVNPPQYEEGAVIAKGWNTHTITEDDVKRMVIATDGEGNQWHAVLDGNSAVMKQGEAPYKFDEVYLGGGLNPSDSNAGISQSSSVATFEKAKSMLSKDGTIYIGGSVEINGSESWSLPRDEYGAATVKRLPENQGGAASSYSGSLVDIKEGAELTLKDITIDGGAQWDGLVNSPAANAGNKGVSVSGEGEEGSLINAAGRLKLEDGAVLQNADKRKGSGGAVYVQGGGSLNMGEGAEIKNNKAQSGAGVYAENDAVVDISGGSISNNKAMDTAGGIYAEGVLNIGQADISGNMANVGGALVATDQATIDGALLSHNRANKSGGAAVLSGDGDIKNTELNNNTSPSGGAVYLEEGADVSVEGTDIKDNTALTGGGLFVENGSQLKLGDNTAINGNSSVLSGGGVYQDGELQVGGNVDISGNQLATKQSDVFLANETSMVQVAQPLTGEGTIGVDSIYDSPMVAGSDGVDLGETEVARFQNLGAGQLVASQPADIAQATPQPEPTMKPFQPEQSGQAVETNEPATETQQPEQTPELVQPKIQARTFAMGLMNSIDQSLTRGMEDAGQENNYLNIEIDDFGEKTFGYADSDIFESAVLVTNNGVKEIEFKNITLTGVDADAFTLSPEGEITRSVDPEKMISLGTVKPKQGLPARGTPYKAQVAITISGEDVPVTSTVSFKVNAIDGSNMTYTAPDTNYEYTGSAIEPDMESIKVNGIELVKGTDYDIIYGENIDAGEDAGSIQIKLKGNYSGEKNLKFTIDPILIDRDELTLRKPQTGEPPQTITAAETDPFTITPQWTKAVGDSFEANTIYTLNLVYKAKKNHAFRSDFEVNISGDANESGSYMAAPVVTPVDKDMHVKVEFARTRSGKVEKVVVSSLPTKMDYIVGEKMDLTGMKAKIYYEGDASPEEYEYANFGHRLSINPGFEHGVKLEKNKHHNKVIDVIYTYNPDARGYTDRFLNIMSDDVGISEIRVYSEYKMTQTKYAFSLILPPGLEIPKTQNEFTVKTADPDAKYKPLFAENTNWEDWTLVVMAHSDPNIQQKYQVVVTTAEREKQRNQDRANNVVRILEAYFAGPVKVEVDDNIINKKLFDEWVMNKSIQALRNAGMDENEILKYTMRVNITQFVPPEDGDLTNLPGRNGNYKFSISVTRNSPEETVKDSTTATGVTKELTLSKQAIAYVPNPKVNIRAVPGTEVLAGQTTVLHADYEDMLNPSFLWYRSDVADNTAGTLLDGHKLSTLELTPRVTTFQAYYYCVATDKASGAIRSDPVEVKVVLPKPEVALPIGVKLLDGKTLELQPEIKSTVGTLSYQWLLDGVELEGMTDEKLTIENFSYLNEGNYSLKVTLEYDGADTYTVSNACKVELAPIGKDVVDQNRINGLKEDQIVKAGTETVVVAVGANMNLKAPTVGTLGYRPISWSVNPNGTFPEDGPYEARFTLEEAGDYELTMVFKKQVWNGVSWEDILNADDTPVTVEQKVPFSVQAKAATPEPSATPTPSPTPTPEPGTTPAPSPTPTPEPGATPTLTPIPSEAGKATPTPTPSGSNDTNGNNGTGNNGTNGTGGANNGTGNAGNNNGTGGNNNGTGGTNGTNATPTPTPSAGTNGTGDSNTKSGDKASPTPTGSAGTGGSSASPTPGGGTGGTGGTGSESTASPTPTGSDEWAEDTKDVSKPPKTGDEQSGAPWILLLLVSAAVAGGLVYRNKKAAKKADEE